MLDREADVQDVSLPDYVLLSLHAEPAFRLRRGQAPRLDQLVVGDDLGPDEPPLQVGVDDPGRFRSGRTSTDLPRPGLVLARRQERDEIKRRAAGRDQP